MASRLYPEGHPATEKTAFSWKKELVYFLTMWVLIFASSVLTIWIIAYLVS